MPRVSAAATGLLLTALAWSSAAGLVADPPPALDPLPPPLPPALPLVPGLNSDFLDGLDFTAFAPAVHHHDDRYYTEAESDARFLGIAAKAVDSDLLDGRDSASFADAGHDHDARYLGIAAQAVDSDLLDGLDSTQFLRQDTSIAVQGDVTAGGHVRAGAGFCLAGDCRSEFPGPFATLRASRGRTLEFPLESSSTCAHLAGSGGTIDCIQPAVRVGRADAPERGRFPPGTVVTYGLVASLGSAGGCCPFNTPVPVLGGVVSLHKYPASDGLHPAKLRVGYVDLVSTGQMVMEDWLTYADQTVYLELEFTVRGDAPTTTFCPGTCRVVDVRLTSDGGQAKAITGLLVYGTSTLVENFNHAPAPMNWFSFLGGAGRIQLPGA